MFHYFINAISRALGFSKTESRGTLVLIFIIFFSIISTRIRIYHLKNEPFPPSDSTTFDWVSKVQASYDLKSSKFEVPKKSFPKKVFQKYESKKVKKATLEIAKEEPKKIIIRDLNSASNEELQTVNGIGPSFSKRITKYRQLLGGFSNLAQLTEVYGLKSETIDELEKHFQIISDVTPIEINSDSLKILAKHPYMSYDLARIIINYRKAHGDIKSVDDLRKIKALDEATFLRLKPYLK